MTEQVNGGKQSTFAETSLTLSARPERKFIRAAGDECFLDFHIRVGSAPATTRERLPLKLALILDRSGSMQGEKLRTAKRATLTLLDQLTIRDSVAVVVFDDRVDVVQAIAPVTPALKNTVKEALEKIEARANTALHEGWLTGCNAIVTDAGGSDGHPLMHCFLLTDGIANVGETDPERIAGEAAGVRERTHISTSTFGVGQDYNELLLGPMAVAGGGQFHNLRRPEEILHTFVGELGELLRVAVRQLRLEMVLENGLQMDLLSPFWLDTEKNTIAIGDQAYDAEQHAIIRVRFPEQWSSERRTVRARLAWLEGTREQKGVWQELHFTYANPTICAQEVHDPEVVHWASLHEADQARREALTRNKHGDYASAQKILHSVALKIAHAAGTDEALQAEVDALQSLATPMAAPMAPSISKEVYYQQHMRSHNSHDYRDTEPEAPEKQ